MSTITFTPEKAPSTPLNLRFNVVYAPRIPTPPFVGYSVTEEADGLYLNSYYEDGTGAIVGCSSVGEAWSRLAQHLRMDVAP